MESFLQKHAGDVIGVLSGFDRLVLRGTVRRMAYVDGMMGFLYSRQVLLKDFGRYAEQVTAQVKQASLAVAERAARPVVYLRSPKADKDAVAREIASRDHVEAGLVCVLSCVEPCRTFDIFRNRDAKRLELVIRDRQCLHLYHYCIHPRFGFMYSRLQTWFPFSIQIGINGREWLSRQMDHVGLGYTRRDNTFTWLESVARAQTLFDRQLTIAWPHHLNAIARQIHPVFAQTFGPLPVDYYWSVYQSEWATDVMFRDEATLLHLYPKLLHHGMSTFDSPDVLRFLGRVVPQHGGVRANFKGEVTSDIKRRPEGLRIKHRAGRNSIKAYNKSNNLRVETTINQPHDFKVYRTREGHSDDDLAWLPLRQGVADLHRRAQVSQAANDRYLDALAAVDNTTALAEFVDEVCKPTTWNGKRVRALRPWEPQEVALLEAVSSGDFFINGLRNRDLRPHLYPTPATDKAEDRRRGAAVTRKLRILRAHGLISKVPRTHRYTVTDKGRAIIAALLAARRANTDALIQLAA